MREHALGLMALSQRDREKALEQFRTCVELDVTASERWAEASIQHIESDPHWPRCNPHIRANAR